jgi:hypothetical protein
VDTGFSRQTMLIQNAASCEKVDTGFSRQTMLIQNAASCEKAAHGSRGKRCSIKTWSMTRDSTKGIML